MLDDLLVSCLGRAGVSHVLMPHIKLTFRPKSLYTFFFWRGQGGQCSRGPVPDNIPTAGAGRAAAGRGSPGAPPKGWQCRHTTQLAADPGPGNTHTQQKK